MTSTHSNTWDIVILAVVIVGYGFAMFLVCPFIPECTTLPEAAKDDVRGMWQSFGQTYSLKTLSDMFAYALLTMKSFVNAWVCILAFLLEVGYCLFERLCSAITRNTDHNGMMCMRLHGPTMNAVASLILFHIVLAGLVYIAVGQSESEKEQIK